MATNTKPTQRTPRTHLSAATRPALEARDGTLCAICRQPAEFLEIDHILPLHAGGTDDLDNLRLVCRAFNRGGRCPSLRTPRSGRKPNHRPHQPPQVDGTTTKPTLTVDIQMSRQFYFHQLALPGDPLPTYHRWLWQAIEAAELAGCDALTIVVADTEYQLSLKQETP